MSRRRRTELLNQSGDTVASTEPAEPVEPGPVESEPGADGQPLTAEKERIPQGIVDTVRHQQQQLAPARRGRGRPKGTGSKPKTDSAETEKLMSSFVEGIGIMLAAGLGPHWQLDKSESRLLAAAWAPLAEHYSVEPGIWMLWVTAGSTTIGIFGPRLHVSIQQKSGLIGKIGGWFKRRRDKSK